MIKISDSKREDIGEYVANTGCTVRSAAEKFQVSKSTVHRILTKDLIILDYNLYCRCRQVLLVNLRDRAYRGGRATREKYRKIAKEKHSAV